MADEWPSPTYFCSVCSLASNLIRSSRNKIKTNDCFLFPMFFSLEFGNIMVDLECNSFRDVFCRHCQQCIDDDHLCVFKDGDKKAFKRGWTFISNHFLDEFRAPAFALGLFLALASTWECFF